MKEKYKPLLVAIVTFTLMLNVVTFLASRARMDSPPSAAAPVDTRGCRVEILAPRPGETLGPTGVVEGRASIPGGAYLWVLGRRKPLGRWRPQAVGPARIESGRWAVRVDHGNARDRGQELYFAAAVVDAGVHRQLERGADSPIRFPETVPGCELAMVAVRRAP